MLYVDAIEDGRIVKVSEDYARREGLMILRKRVEEVQNKPVQKKDEGNKFLFDDFRRPLKMKDNQVFSELVDNFHWILSKKRKGLGLSRKQVAQRINVSENDLKMIENGVLPSNDFILINKLMSFYGVNLRKDGKDFSRAVREAVVNKESFKGRDIGEQKRGEKASDSGFSSSSGIEFVDLE